MSGSKSLWRRSVSVFKPNATAPTDTDDRMAFGSTGDSAAGAQVDQQHQHAPVRVAIVGAGQRGTNYAEYALKQPTDCKVVAVAEPRPQTRKRMVDAHKIDSSLVFEDWKELCKAPAVISEARDQRPFDAVLVTVQDSMHREVVEAFAPLGYAILCEKPMATSVEDCLRMHDAVKKAGVIFGCGHVLRYSPYSKDLTAQIRSGQFGELINAAHVEPVGYYHFAHSYVRGNWRNEQESCFSLMTKCCHDIDILAHWFAPQVPARVSSFGSLRHFRKEAKPPEAGDATRCVSCAYERECPYSAKKIYLEPVARGGIGWPSTVLVDAIPDIENITEALEHGPYGRCVYECDNDVCDNQIVNIEYSDGATASLTMVAHTSLICERQTRLHFSHGEIVGDMTSFNTTDYRKRHTRRITPRSDGGGHGGGDLGLMSAFVEAVRTGSQEPLGTDIGEVLRAHLTVFAAERSRLEGRVVDCREFEKEERSKLGLEAPSS